MYVVLIVAPETVWAVDGTPAGTFQSALGLTFMRVYNSGHMVNFAPLLGKSELYLPSKPGCTQVPMDQPPNALDLLNRFVRDEPFGTSSSSPALA